MSETNFAREVLAPIRAIVGDEGIITDPHAMEPYLNSWRDNWRGGRFSGLINRSGIEETTSETLETRRSCYG